MNKKELIRAVSVKTGFSQKDITEVVETILNVIVDEVKNGKEVSITGFGKFIANTRNARNGVNPKTGETIAIKESRVPKFRAGSAFKAAVAI